VTAVGALLAAGAARDRPHWSTLGTGFGYRRYAGGKRGLADDRSKVANAFFGYTQCPDVHPTALARTAEVMQQFRAQTDHDTALLLAAAPSLERLLEEGAEDARLDASAMGLAGGACRIERLYFDDLPARFDFECVPGSGVVVDSLRHRLAQASSAELHRRRTPVWTAVRRVRIPAGSNR